MMHTHFMKRTLALISALLAGPIFAADAPHGTKAKYLLLNYSTSIASTNQAAATPTRAQSGTVISTSPAVLARSSPTRARKMRAARVGAPVRIAVTAT